MPNTSGTILHYFVTALSFTLLCVWIITAFQSRYNLRSGVTFWHRLGCVFVLQKFDKDLRVCSVNPDNVRILINFLPGIVFM